MSSCMSAGCSLAGGRDTVPFLAITALFTGSFLCLTSMVLTEPRELVSWMLELYRLLCREVEICSLSLSLKRVYLYRKLIILNEKNKSALNG
jgi:hypothetical protein